MRTLEELFSNIVETTTDLLSEEIVGNFTEDITTELEQIRNGRSGSVDRMEKLDDIFVGFKQEMETLFAVENSPIDSVRDLGGLDEILQESRYSHILGKVLETVVRRY